jgi:hypothetical protein
MVLRCTSALKKANPITHLQPIPLCWGRVVRAGGIARPVPRQHQWHRFDVVI